MLKSGFPLLSGLDYGGIATIPSTNGLSPLACADGDGGNLNAKNR